MHGSNSQFREYIHKDIVTVYTTLCTHWQVHKISSFLFRFYEAVNKANRTLQWVCEFEVCGVCVCVSMCFWHWMVQITTSLLRRRVQIVILKACGYSANDEHIPHYFHHHCRRRRHCRYRLHRSYECTWTKTYFKWFILELIISVFNWHDKLINSWNTCVIPITIISNSRHSFAQADEKNKRAQTNNNNNTNIIEIHNKMIHTSYFSCFFFIYNRNYAQRWDLCALRTLSLSLSFFLFLFLSLAPHLSSHYILLI